MSTHAKNIEIDIYNFFKKTIKKLFKINNIWEILEKNKNSKFENSNKFELKN